MDPEKVLSLFKTDLLAITTPRGQRSVEDQVQQVHLFKKFEFLFYDDDTLNPFSEIWTQLGIVVGPVWPSWVVRPQF